MKKITEGPKSTLLFRKFPFSFSIPIPFLIQVFRSHFLFPYHFPFPAFPVAPCMHYIVSEGDGLGVEEGGMERERSGGS